MVKNTNRPEVLKRLAQVGLAVSLLLLAARIAPVFGQEFRGLILGQVTDTHWHLHKSETKDLRALQAASAAA